VAAPIEQQMTGVAKMLYMYSTSASNGGQMNLRVDFDVTTDPSTDQVLAQMRSSQAIAQLPPQVQEVGVTVRKSASSPLALFTMYSPNGTYDQLFISNYAYININDPMTRVQGIGQVQIFGAGQYAMRVWLRPDALAKLQITTNDVSLADLPWWDVFGDATLQALIREAIARNYDLQIATARVAQARAQAGVANAAFYPSIGYNLKVQRSKEYAAFLGIQSNQFTPSASNLFLGALSATWEIDVWGGIRRSNEAAVAELLATEEGRRGVLLSLVSDVAQAYFELIELDARLEISRATVAAYGGIYRIFNDRLEFGVASELEVARAEGALFSAAATISELKSQVAAKENQISTLLGKNPSEIPRGTPLFAQPVPPTVPAGLPSALLERRPDVMKLEEQLAAANANVGVAKANFFPQMSLTGILGKASPELALMTSGASTIWAIAASLTGPIFQGGRILLPGRAGSVGAGEAPVRAGRDQGVPGSLDESGGARSASRGRDGAGPLGQGAAEGCRAGGGPIPLRPLQLLRGTRCGGEAVPCPERSGRGSAESAGRLRPALQGARWWMEPQAVSGDRRGFERDGSFQSLGAPFRTHCAVYPPSTGRHTPVTNDASSDARNSAAAAISAG
jgi:NodT family efflux transporter outer membrane factor (OMF) lipoprotein